MTFAIGKRRTRIKVLSMEVAGRHCHGVCIGTVLDPGGPLVPIANSGKFVIWVIASVILDVVDMNVLYDPVVLGAAAKLHPLVVLIGVVGGRHAVWST